MRKRRVVILGSTGSIGESALKVARDIPDRMEVVGLAAGKNAARLAEQVREFRPRLASLAEPSEVEVDCELLHGDEGLCELARMPEADLVLIAIVGTAGLRPALAAIESGKDIAVASKEILVMAGEAVMTAAREHGVQVLPVDSEHNAIFQCLEGRSSEQVRRIILTASGGPFRTLPAVRNRHIAYCKGQSTVKYRIPRCATIGCFENAACRCTNVNGLWAGRMNR